MLPSENVAETPPVTPVLALPLAVGARVLNVAAKAVATAFDVADWLVTPSEIVELRESDIISTTLILTSASPVEIVASKVGAGKVLSDRVVTWSPSETIADTPETGTSTPYGPANVPSDAEMLN